VSVEALENLPEATVGWTVTGKITSEEYYEMLNPVLDRLEQGETLNLLVVADDDFHGLDAPALWEDMKNAPKAGIKYRKSWRRVAVVTNKQWLHHAVASMGWLYPGEMRVFDLDELHAAKAWIAEPPTTSAM
jgi:SpoIIAA-like